MWPWGNGSSVNHGKKQLSCGDSSQGPLYHCLTRFPAPTHPTEWLNHLFIFCSSLLFKSGETSETCSLVAFKCEKPEPRVSFTQVLNLFIPQKTNIIKQTFQVFWWIFYVCPPPKCKMSVLALNGQISCKNTRSFFFPLASRTESVTPKALFQSKPLKRSAGTSLFFLLKHTHIHTLLRAVLFLQTMLKVSKTQLIMMPQQRLRSSHFMWPFLVKLAKYMNPSRRNALSHSGLCFWVNVICNKVFLFRSGTMLTLGLSTWSPSRAFPGFQLGPLMKVDNLSLMVW